MDFAALLEPLIRFFSEGIGKVIADVARALYAILYPANAEAAHPVPLPD
ncbi:hypothetical protein [Corynebacterium timonense]|uniref:Uncharacterized protein n=1 Tax=Corynebacterium timonense TaxID=441500 RepID=A0A1H1UVE4_9CORY|nr:hypothetical protein [Corynebacterium timonense]SDS76492.1 hypothetical protein SAMN04488539_2344 [Corynebacterium timonense]